jgi:hypothetical protein
MLATPRTDRQPATRTVTALALHGLLTIAGIVVAKAARDALCVTVYTPRQIATAEVAAVAATALLIGVQVRVFKHASFGSLLRAAPIVFACGDLVLSASSGVLPPRVLGALTYLWVSLQASLLAPLVPVAAALALSIAQAARVCGVVGAGTTVGWIGGGVLTTIVAVHGGVAGLLLTAAAVTASSTAAVLLLGPLDQTTCCANLGTRTHLWDRTRKICHSPRLRPLALLALVSSVVTTIVGLQFKLIASGPAQSTAELAKFLGHATLVSGCAALIIQLLATARLVRTFHLRVALLVTPCVLGLGLVSTLATGSLLAAMFVRSSDQVFRYTVDRTGIDLLYRPLTTDQMFEYRPFIDAVVSRLGDVTGSLLVLTTVVTAARPVVWLSLLAMGLLVAWGTLACAAARSYGDELRALLRLPPSIAVPRPSSLDPWLTAA